MCCGYERLFRTHSLCTEKRSPRVAYVISVHHFKLNEKVVLKACLQIMSLFGRHIQSHDRVSLLTEVRMEGGGEVKRADELSLG